MRVLAREVLFIGQDQCPEFNCPEPMPEELNILLCLMDGAERRRHFQAQLNALHPAAKKVMLSVKTRIPILAWVLAGLVALFSIASSLIGALPAYTQSMHGGVGQMDKSGVGWGDAHSPF
jgi:hypothetical protein